MIEKDLQREKSKNIWNETTITDLGIGNKRLMVDEIDSAVHLN